MVEKSNSKKLTLGCRLRPVVWYVSAGFKLPAGIEAYLCHYATEMRNHGFDTRIIVFYPLPREKHRFLRMVEKRSIPIMSLYDDTAIYVVLLFVLFSLPWFLYMLVFKRKFPCFGTFYCWIQNRCSVNCLAKMIREESPDIIHVKGRLPTNAWEVFPSACTIYHHALMGTVDPSWTTKEVEDFRTFAARVAFILVPGKNIVETLAKEFRIERPIEPIFAMAPDEFEKNKTGNLNPDVQNLRWESVREEFSTSSSYQRRFGIVCRFTEQKGISYILEALKCFRDKRGDVAFTFIGQGDLEPVIRGFVKANDLHNVKIESMTGVLDAFSRMDVMVHPGLDDAMPVSIVEALMFGVPCISTRIGGVPDLVRNRVEGFLIEPSNAGQILECMERFADMPVEEFGKYRQRARARYEEVCLPDKVGQQVAGYYREIISRR